MWLSYLFDRLCQVKAMSFLFVNFIFFLCVVTVKCVKFPDDFTRCNLKDPNLNECLKLGQKDAILKLANGRKSLGIPALDPLKVDKIDIDQTSSGPVNLKQYFKNVELFGFSTYDILKVDSQFDKNKLVIETINPVIQMIGDYEMTGRILLLPIQGNGKFNMTLVQLKTIQTLFGKKVEKNGKTYWPIQKYQVEFEPKRVYLSFGNLFNGDENLGKTMNDFLNENWQVMFEELGPQFEQTFGIIFKQLANQIFQRIPMNEIFLDS